jgi:hypothetical protein
MRQDKGLAEMGRAKWLPGTRGWPGNIGIGSEFRAPLDCDCWGAKIQSDIPADRAVDRRLVSEIREYNCMLLKKMVDDYKRSLLGFIQLIQIERKAGHRRGLLPLVLCLHKN